MSENKIIRVMGGDPSFTKFGYVIADVDVDSLIVVPTEVGCIRTAKTKNKSVLVSSDNVRRIREIHKPIEALSKTVDLLMMEVPTGGAQSHSAAVALAYATAIVGCLHTPMVQLTPTQVKKASVGTGTASKEEMIAWAYAKHPEIEWTKTKVQDEHIADALAAIYAGIESEQFLMSLSFAA